MHDRPTFDRRSLVVGGISALGAAALLGRRAEARVRLFGPRVDDGAAAGRTLVLVQLTGGNDGLSMVVPYGDDAYGKARTATRIGEKEVLKLDGYRGLHPALKGLKAHYDEGRVAIVEGCGYPDPIRSHFKSYEVWHAASRAGRAAGQGWVGRLAGAAWDDAVTPELVVHVGANAPFSVFSTAHPPIIFQTPNSYRWAGAETEDLAAYRRAAEEDARKIEELRRAKAEGAAAGATGRERAIERLRGVLADANESSSRIRRAAALYTTEAKYPDDDFGEALRIAASLIDARVGTRVVSVELGGFDSHNDQRAQHDERMRRLNGGLTAFLDDLAGRSAAKDVVVVVFSEFGRRVVENGSRGTDHGTAGPMLVLGAPVRGGLYGEHPSMTELDHGDLKFTTDFRRVYATVIERWFGADAARVLGPGFAPLELLA